MQSVKGASRGSLEGLPVVVEGASGAREWLPFLRVQWDFLFTHLYLCYTSSRKLGVRTPHNINKFRGHWPVISLVCAIFIAGEFMTSQGKTLVEGVLKPIEWMTKPGMRNNDDQTNPAELDARLKELNQTRVDDLLHLLQSDE